jgi:type IX secretion system PorP/SprF family membrane protein
MKNVLNYLRGFFLTVMLSGIAFTSYGQQKIQFTQYMFNNLVINPAYAGAEEALSLTFINRDQWRGVENAPTTQSLSAHTLFRKQHSGVGVTLINDKLGVHKNISFLAVYAYHLRLANASVLSMGLQAGVNNTKSDYASLMGGSSNDPRLYNPLINRTYMNFGTGIYFRSPRLHVGVSSPELLPGKVDVNDTLSIRLRRSNIFLFGKYRVNLSEKLEGEPNLLVKYFYGVPASFDISMNFVYARVLTAGLSYRMKESVDFLLKAQVTGQLQLGYSYDHSIGNVSRLSNGSHELMVNYIFRYVKTNITSPR